MMTMTVSRTRLGIGVLLGVLVCVVIGYSILLPLWTVTANPFAEHIDQIESHIRALIAQIIDLQSQLSFPSPIAIMPQ
jgi:hypothetical protein